MAEDQDANRRYFEFHVFFCTNERAEGHTRGSCARRGSVKLREYMKARAKELGIQSARVNAAGCLDRCELGPTMVVYPEGIWYSVASTSDVDEIISAHLIGGRPVDRLRLHPDDRFPEDRAARKAATDSKVA